MSGHASSCPPGSLEETLQSIQVNEDHLVWSVCQVRGVLNHGLSAFYTVTLGERLWKHSKVPLVTTQGSSCCASVPPYPFCLLVGFPVKASHSTTPSWTISCLEAKMEGRNFATRNFQAKTLSRDMQQEWEESCLLREGWGCLSFFFFYFDNSSARLRHQSLSLTFLLHQTCNDRVPTALGSRDRRQTPWCQRTSQQFLMKI